MAKSNEHGLDNWCGSALQVRRQAARMTLKQLADKIGTTTSTLHRWEKEVHPPTQEDVQQLAAVFSTEPEDFSREPKVV